MKNVAFAKTSFLMADAEGQELLFFKLNPNTFQVDLIKKLNNVSETNNIMTRQISN
jgi:hypothetical protein